MIKCVAHQKFLDAYMSQENILIATGDDDNDSFYQAQRGESSSPSSLTLYFHKTSRFLDRIRLFGSETVHAYVGGQKFIGELRFFCFANIDNEETIALEFVINDSTKDDGCNGPGIIPRT